MNKLKVVGVLAATLFSVCLPGVDVYAQTTSNTLMTSQAEASEEINVGTAKIRMEIYNSEFEIVNPLIAGFKCNSGIMKTIQEDSITLYVPINDTVDTLNNTKFNYEISYKSSNKILATNELGCEIKLNNIIVNKSNSNDIAYANRLEKGTSIDSFETVNIDPIQCTFSNDYFIKFYIEDIESTNKSVDEYSSMFVNINLLEEDSKILELETLNYDLCDLFTDGDYVNPIEDVVLDRDVTIQNGLLDISCDRMCEIYSMDDNGKLEYYGNDVLVVQYDNCRVIYENIILTNNTEDFSQGDVLGIASTDNVKVYIEKDGYYANTNCFYSDFNYSSVLRTVPQYLQKDEKWGSNSYGSSTISASGCGPSSFSMVLSSIKGIEYTTDMVVSDMYDLRDGKWSWFYCPGEGSYHAIFAILGEMYDIEVEDRISVSKKNLISTLEEEKLVIVSINNGPIYKGDGHYIVIYGTEDDKFYISDSAGLFEQDKLYTYEQLGNVTVGFSFK